MIMGSGGSAATDPKPMGPQIQQIPQNWKKVKRYAMATGRLAWGVTQVITFLMVIMAEIAYENREKILKWMIAVYAAMVIVGEDVFEAGKATRAWVERIAVAAPKEASKLPETISPIAPILGVTMAVSKSAAKCLNSWLFSEEAPATVDQSINQPKSEIPQFNYDDLMQLSAATLREMVGTSRKYSKAKLASMLMAA